LRAKKAVHRKQAVPVFKICESVAIITMNYNSKFIYTNIFLNAIALSTFWAFLKIHKKHLSLKSET
jgi:hypothetical protein